MCLCESSINMTHICLPLLEIVEYTYKYCNITRVEILVDITPVNPLEDKFLIEFTTKLNDTTKISFQVKKLI